MALASSGIQEVTAQMEYIETHFSESRMPNEALKAVFDRAIADCEKQRGLALTVPEKTRIWAEISREPLCALKQEFETLLLEHVVTSNKPKDAEVAQNLEKNREKIEGALREKAQKLGVADKVQATISSKFGQPISKREKLAEHMSNTRTVLDWTPYLNAKELSKVSPLDALRIMKKAYVPLVPVLQKGEREYWSTLLKPLSEETVDTILREFEQTGASNHPALMGLHDAQLLGACIKPYCTQLEEALKREVAKTLSEEKKSESAAAPSASGASSSSVSNRQKVAELISDMSGPLEIAVSESDALKTASSQKIQRIVEKISPQLLPDLKKAKIEFWLPKLQSLSNDTLESVIEDFAQRGKTLNPVLMGMMLENMLSMMEQIDAPFNARFEDACKREMGVGAAAAASAAAPQVENHPEPEDPKKRCELPCAIL